MKSKLIFVTICFIVVIVVDTSHSTQRTITNRNSTAVLCGFSKLTDSSFQFVLPPFKRLN